MGRLAWHAAVLVTAFCIRDSAAQELRGVRFELPALFAAASPEQIVENVAAIRFNTIMCTVMPEEAADPRFAALLALAHSRGLRVDAVLSTMVPGGTGPSLKADPTTHAVNSGGRLVSEWLCPSRPKVRGWAANLASAMASLGVDGIQLDYIRFGGPDCLLDFCSRSERHFTAACPAARGHFCPRKKIEFVRGWYLPPRSA